MSLLWRTAIAVHMADPATIERIKNGPKEIPVTHAGFKSHVWGTPHSGFWQGTHDPAEELGRETMERLHDETWKEPRPQSQDSYGDPNSAHYESHDRRLEERAQQELDQRQGDRNDELHSFLFNHASNKDFWDKVPTQHVSLEQPIHATQPYVLRDHLTRYLKSPYGQTDHADRNIGAPIHHDVDHSSGESHPYYRTDEQTAPKYRKQMVDDYYGNKTPGFVKHQGKVHAVEGHHRVGAALLRGDTGIHAKFYDADKHGFPDPPEDED